MVGISTKYSKEISKAEDDVDH
jgi:hypothetical protein